MKLIPLDALLAKINKRITDAPINYIGHQRVWAYNDVKDIIDTIEVKEMDINEEISQFIDANFEKATIGHKLSLRRVAKHFFELGVSASNPTTAADRGTAEEIIINLKRVEQDYRINLTKEIEWVRNQVKKGE